MLENTYTIHMRLHGCQPLLEICDATSGKVMLEWSPNRPCYDDNLLAKEELKTLVHRLLLLSSVSVKI